MRPDPVKLLAELDAFLDGPHPGILSRAESRQVITAAELDELQRLRRRVAELDSATGFAAFDGELGPALDLDNPDALADYAGPADDCGGLPNADLCEVDRGPRMLDSSELWDRVVRAAQGTGLVDCEAIAERLARGRGDVRRAQLDSYRYSLAGMLQDATGWEIVETGRDGLPAVFRCYMPDILLAGLPDRTAHLRLRFDGTADPAYLRLAQDYLAGRRQRAGLKPARAGARR